jgi:hypothetical protein
MPHELMHWHEGGLLGGAKPANQLVANIVVLFTIPILTIWLVLVNYQHLPVGISGLY